MRPHKCYPDYNFYNISPYKLVQLHETLLQELDALAASDVPALAWPESPSFGLALGGSGLRKL